MLLYQIFDKLHVNNLLILNNAEKNFNLNKKELKINSYLNSKLMWKRKKMNKLIFQVNTWKTKLYNN